MNTGNDSLADYCLKRLATPLTAVANIASNVSFRFSLLTEAEIILSFTHTFYSVNNGVE